MDYIFPEAKAVDEAPAVPVSNPDMVGFYSQLEQKNIFSWSSFWGRGVSEDDENQNG